MSRLSDLIADLCRCGVEFAPLGEIGNIYGGLTGKSKADFTGGSARFVSYVNVFNNDIARFDLDDFVVVGENERQNAVRFGDVLFTASSENAEDVGMSSVVPESPAEPTYLNSFCFGFRPNERETLHPGFAKHLFRSQLIRHQIAKTANGVTRFNISKGRFREIKVPLVPYEAQVELAAILDKFKELERELERELEGELEARRRQYEHYRDVLLSFPEAEGVCWIPMCEVGTFIRGRRFVKDDIVNDGLPAIHYGEIYTHYGTSTTSALSHVRAEIASRLRFAQPGDVVIAAVGETVEDVGKAVAWLGDGPVAVHDDCFAFSHSENPKFIAYCMQTSALIADKDKYVSRAKVKRLSAEGLAKLVIPVPTLDEQERIVDILDKFDGLVNDLSIGLPAELRARRQQYEFYRDKLLTFEESAA